MAARAMWKGVIRFESVKVPVKLYSAVQDRSVHFRLLHEKDHSPVRQAMINPDTGKAVPHAETRRAYRTAEGSLVIFDKEELEALEPPKGKALDAKELDMARQLIGMLEAEFDPHEYHDEYRERVLELIEAKRLGKRVKITPIRRREATDDLAQALEASLKKERKRA